MFFQFAHFLQFGPTLAKFFKFEVSSGRAVLITSAFGLEEAREPQRLTLQLNSRVWVHRSLGVRVPEQTPGSLHSHVVTQPKLLEPV